MGDGKNGDLRVDFDRRVKLTFLGSKVTTDAGLLAYRELDEVLGLTETADDFLCDSRVGSNKTTPTHDALAAVRSIVVWQATKTSTMPSALEPIRPCVTLWVAGQANQRSGQLR